MKSSINRSSVSCWHQNNNSYKTFFYWRSHNDALLLGIKQRKIRFTPVAPWSHRLTHLHKTLSQKKKKKFQCVTTEKDRPQPFSHSLSLPGCEMSSGDVLSNGLSWSKPCRVSHVWETQRISNPGRVQRVDVWQVSRSWALMKNIWAGCSFSRRTGGERGGERGRGEKTWRGWQFCDVSQPQFKMKKNNNNKTKHWFVRVCGGVHYIYRGPGGAPWGTPSMFTVKCDCFIYLNQGVNIYYHILNIPSPTQTTSGVLIAPIWLFKAPKTGFFAAFCLWHQSIYLELQWITANWKASHLFTLMIWSLMGLMSWKLCWLTRL